MATTPPTDTIVEALAVDPATIMTHPDNPRKDAAADDELVASVAAKGVLMALQLAPVPEGVEAPDGQEFVLIAGHRRLDAAVRAGLTQVPALVRRDLDTRAAQIEVMIAENLARKDLTPLEEGDAYLTLFDLGLSQAQVAGDTGMAKSRVSERTRVARLPESARAKLAAQQITLDAALSLAKVDDPAEVERIAAQPAYLWDGEVRRVLAAQEQAREVTRREKELAKAGVKVLDEYPPTPDVDEGDDAPGAWWRLDDLLDMAYEGITSAAVEHAGIEVEDGAEAGEYLDQEAIDAWHQATCAGHAVVRQALTDWQGTRTVWVAICTTPAAHDDLLDVDETPDSLSLATDPDAFHTAAGRNTPDEPQEAPEVAARRAHLESRVDQHTRWLAKVLEQNPPALHARALADARARLPRIEFTDDGELVQAYKQHDLDRRRSFLGLPDEASPADVEEAFHAFADRLDFGQLHLLYSLVEHGPAYGEALMRKPGGFDHGWAPARVRLLHDLGWAWDDEELDEIRQHPKLAASLGLDAGADENDDAQAEGEVA